jgi:hypothetical protein
MINHGTILVQLLHCPLLSSCQLKSTLPPTAQLLLTQSQHGDLVRYHPWLSSALYRIPWPLLNHFTATNTYQEIFPYEYPLHQVFLPIKMHNRMLLFSSILLNQSPFWLVKSASEHAHTYLLLRLSWRWTALLPSDIHSKPVTSIRAVLRPFVTYLLTLPPISWGENDTTFAAPLQKPADGYCACAAAFPIVTSTRLHKFLHFHHKLLACIFTENAIIQLL